jgi:hypothetical protein
MPGMPDASRGTNIVASTMPAPGNHRIQPLLFSIFNVVDSQRSLRKHSMIHPFVTRSTILNNSSLLRSRRNDGGDKPRSNNCARPMA